jgi:hypothetical protein
MQNQQHNLAAPPSRRARRNTAAACLVAVVALALPASALAAGFSVKLHIANHTPVVGKRWPIELTITRGKQKLSGTVRYQFLYDKAVVSTAPKHGGFKFTRGVYRDILVFPSQSLGEQLTLRFVVHTRYGTEHADWTIRAKKSA